MARADSVSDLTLLVRTPGNVNGYRAYTEQDRGEAEKYAASQGVQVEQLP